MKKILFLDMLKIKLDKVKYIQHLCSKNYDKETRISKRLLSEE